MKLFLSYSKPINKEQIQLLNDVKELINNSSIDIDIIEINNINDFTISPIHKIIDGIKKSSAFLCIAFEKNQINTINNVTQYYTSHWLDIELSLAIQNNIPYFIIMESHLSDNEILSIQQKTISINLIEVDFTNKQNRYYKDSYDYILVLICDWIDYISKILFI